MYQSCGILTLTGYLELVGNTVSLPEAVVGDSGTSVAWDRMQCYHNPIFTSTLGEQLVINETERKAKAQRGRPPRPMMSMKHLPAGPKIAPAGKENRITPMRSNHTDLSAIKFDEHLTTPQNMISDEISQYISPLDQVAVIAGSYKGALETRLITAQAPVSHVSSNIHSPRQATPRSNLKPLRVQPLIIREAVFPPVASAKKEILKSVLTLKELWISEALLYIDTIECLELQRYSDIYIHESARVVMQRAKEMADRDLEPAPQALSAAHFTLKSLEQALVRRCTFLF